MNSCVEELKITRFSGRSWTRNNSLDMLKRLDLKKVICEISHKNSTLWTFCEADFEKSDISSAMEASRVVFWLRQPNRNRLIAFDSKLTNVENARAQIGHAWSIFAASFPTWACICRLANRLFPPTRHLVGSEVACGCVNLRSINDKPVWHSLPISLGSRSQLQAESTFRRCALELAASFEALIEIWEFTC